MRWAGADRFQPADAPFYPALAPSMHSDASLAAPTLLEQIDAQQDQLLAELDALNLRIEQVLKDCSLRGLSLVAVVEPVA